MDKQPANSDNILFVTPALWVDTNMLEGMGMVALQDSVGGEVLISRNEIVRLAEVLAGLACKEQSSKRFTFKCA